MVAAWQEEPFAKRIIVALDCGHDEALEIAKSLSGKASWLKVGMTLYYACGPSIVQELKALGFNVFLDLKLHDIPYQVEGAACSAALTGADMLTFHCLGGKKMLQAAERGVLRAAELSGAERAVTLGITVLTSMDGQELEGIGISRTPSDQVMLLAGLAKDAGISGVVASPQEADMLRQLLGPSAYIVTPGVRPAGSSTDDQSRVATPEEAFKAGASHIVIGRPIAKADDPVAAFDAIASSCR